MSIDPTSVQKNKVGHNRVTIYEKIKFESFKLFKWQMISTDTHICKVKDIYGYTTNSLCYTWHWFVPREISYEIVHRYSLLVHDIVVCMGQWFPGRYGEI